MMRSLKTILVGLTVLCSITAVQAQVSAIGYVDHIVPDGVDSLGSITLSVTGGTSPYSYSWTPGGIHTRDISDKTKNTYSLTIKDSGTNTATYQYNIGYKVLWGCFNGAKQQHDTLLNTGKYGWGAALSKNTLPASTDGWFEVVLMSGNATEYFYQQVGFLDSAENISNRVLDIDYGIYILPNQVQRIMDGVYSSRVNYKAGDVFRVERIGSTINYKLNNTVVWTTTNASYASKSLKLRGGSPGGSRPLVNVGCSFSQLGGTYFPNFIKLTPKLVHSTYDSIADGSTTLTANEHVTETYTWQPGSVVSNYINSKLKGAYKGTVQDYQNNKSFYSYNVAYKTQWANFNYTAQKHDSLVNTGGRTWGWAIGRNVLPAGQDGWIETVLAGSTYVQAGFLDSVYASNESSDVDFGFYEYPYGLNTVINGVYTYLGAWNDGDILRLERVGNTINYLLNGDVAYTTTVSGLSSKTLKIKAAVTNLSPMTNLGTSFPQDRAFFVTPTRAPVQQCAGVPILLRSTLGYSVNPTSPVTSYTFNVAGTGTWQPGNLVGDSYVTPTVSTIYTVSIAYGGNTYANSMAVSINAINPTLPASIPFAMPDGVTLGLTVSGGSGPYTYSWGPNLFFINGTTNTQQNPQVSPPASITYTVLITDAGGCTTTATVDVIAEPYAHLHKIPDGSYYNLTNNKLLFKYDGQYATTNLVCNVYNKAHVLVASGSFSSLVVNSGDNRYAYNATSLTPGYYNMEIVNEKNEKLYLRFIR